MAAACRQRPVRSLIRAAVPDNSVAWEPKRS
jgi:hypothetical protein